MPKSTLKPRPQAVRISGAAPELDNSLLWGKTLLHLTDTLTVFMSSVIIHCSPKSMLQLHCAAHYLNIPGACKSVIPLKKPCDWKPGPHILSLAITTAAPDKGEERIPFLVLKFLALFQGYFLTGAVTQGEFSSAARPPLYTHQRSCLAYNATFSLCTLLCYAEKKDLQQY